MTRYDLEAVEVLLTMFCVPVATPGTQLAQKSRSQCKLSAQP